MFFLIKARNFPPFAPIFSILAQKSLHTDGFFALETAQDDFSAGKAAAKSSPSNPVKPSNPTEVNVISGEKAFENTASPLFSAAFSGTLSTQISSPAVKTTTAAADVQALRFICQPVCRESPSKSKPDFSTACFCATSRRPSPFRCKSGRRRRLFPARL